MTAKEAKRRAGAAGGATREIEGRGGGPGRAGPGKRRKQVGPAGCGWSASRIPEVPSPLADPGACSRVYGCPFQGLRVPGLRAAFMFPEEPVGPLWAKGLLWSLGGEAAHLGKEKSCTRAAFFPSPSIYRSPPLGLRRPTVASTLRLLAFQT